VSEPLSYATADEARAYMARVLARPVPAAPPRVYLIMPPALRGSSWAALRPAIAATMRGAELLEHGDVFGPEPIPVEDRVPRIAEAASAALVIPYQFRVPGAELRYLMGYSARREARALVARGLPVLVFTPSGLAAWPDVRTRSARPPHPPWLTLEVDMPGAAPRPLPTVIASMRAIGLPAPKVRRAPRPRPAEAAAPVT